MRQNSTVTATSRRAARGVVFGWAIRGSFHWGFGCPPFYRQTSQHSSRSYRGTSCGLAYSVPLQSHAAGSGFPCGKRNTRNLDRNVPGCRSGRRPHGGADHKGRRIGSGDSESARHSRMGFRPEARHRQVTWHRLRGPRHPAGHAEDGEHHDRSAALATGPPLFALPPPHRSSWSSRPSSNRLLAVRCHQPPLLSREGVERHPLATLLHAVVLRVVDAQRVVA